MTLLDFPPERPESPLRSPGPQLLCQLRPGRAHGTPSADHATADVWPGSSGLAGSPGSAGSLPRVILRGVTLIERSFTHRRRFAQERLAADNPSSFPTCGSSDDPGITPGVDLPQDTNSVEGTAAPLCQPPAGVASSRPTHESARLITHAEWTPDVRPGDDRSVRDAAPDISSGRPAVPTDLSRPLASLSRTRRATAYHEPNDVVIRFSLSVSLDGTLRLRAPAE
jgi:hypothetical protein